MRKKTLVEGDAVPFHWSHDADTAEEWFYFFFLFLFLMVPTLLSDIINAKA